MRVARFLPLSFLLSAASVLSVLSLAPASASAQAQALTPREQALHVLNRLGYGPRPGDIDQVEQLGARRYIARQLDPDGIALPSSLRQQLDALPALQMTPAQLFIDYGPPSFPSKDASGEQKQQARQRAARELTPQWHQARLLRATESPRQLEELMTEFWANHFNVFEGKEWVRYWIGDYENQAIRPHALGRFRDLLGAVAHHPAMLFYLDNWLSSGAGTPGARGRFKGLNENYARELMELHTLGVDGGYQQADVLMLARILSGWSIDVDGLRQGGQAFVFNANRHDASPKVLLGQPLAAGGIEQGEAALDLLAANPATARFICSQLVQFFVADEPDPALVRSLSATFLASGGDIRATLAKLFDSAQFWSRANYQSQFKTPYQFVVSALRATATPVVNAKPADNMLSQLGMPLYGWLTPEGYKYSQAAWLNADALLRRINMAGVLASGRSTIGGDTPPPPADATQLQATLGPAIAPATAARIDAAPPRLRAALVLGSPDFMKR